MVEVWWAGFEVGYGGSGPADLTLNSLALYLPLVPGEAGVRLWDGTRVSQTAWDWHQPFKRRFLATMPYEGGVIAGALIEAWLVAMAAGEATAEKGPPPCP